VLGTKSPCLSPQKQRKTSSPSPSVTKCPCRQIQAKYQALFPNPRNSADDSSRVFRSGGQIGTLDTFGQAVCHRSRSCAHSSADRCKSRRLDRNHLLLRIQIPSRRRAIGQSAQFCGSTRQEMADRACSSSSRFRTLPAEISLILYAPSFRPLSQMESSSFINYLLQHLFLHSAVRP